MKSKDALKLLQVTRTTLCKYHKNGTIKATRLPNGQLDYNEESIYTFLGKTFRENNKKIVIYARTSNPPKKYVDEQISRILSFCTCKGYSVDEIYWDIKSGMNFERPSFNKLIDDVCNQEICMVIVENKDRLVRFGFDLLKNLFKKFNCEIVVINDKSEQNFEQELTEDLISIIHYFSMKSYSNRRKLNKIKKELETNDNP